MVNGIYISSAEGHTGKSMIALGLLSTLSAEGVDVGIFRPVSQSREEPDGLLTRLIAESGIGDDPETCVGVSYEDVHSDPEGSLVTIIQRFKELEARHEAMVILGSDYTDVTTPTELAYNARIAANLGTPVLLVLGGRNTDEATLSNSQFLTGDPRTPEDVRHVAEVAIAELHDEHAKLAGVVVNRAGKVSDEFARALRADDLVPAETPIWIIPEDPHLVSPTIGDLMKHLDGELLYGAEKNLENYVLAYIVSGMNMEHVLERLIEGGVIVVPGDRTEVLLGVLVAQASKNFPNLSGVILNGGFDLSPSIKSLIEGVSTCRSCSPNRAHSRRFWQSPVHGQDSPRLHKKRLRWVARSLPSMW